MSENGLSFIDVQSHFLPPVYREALRNAGIERIDEWAIPDWDVHSALTVMDELGVKAQFLSLSAPGVSFLKGGEAHQLARSVNEYAASVIQEHSPRFGAFACLPLPDVEGALQELTYALDTLQLDGVGLLSNYDGVYLGHQDFDPIFYELNRRGAVLFIHPVAPPHFAPSNVGFTAPIMEYPFDTTRVAGSLLKSGTVERCPDLKIILAHGGGTIPFLSPRLGFALGPQRAALLPSFFYEMTAATMPGQLAAIANLVPAEKLMMGIDFPFMPKAIVRPFLQSFDQSDFSPEERNVIRTGNALHLFPRMAQRLHNGVPSRERVSI